MEWNIIHLEETDSTNRYLRELPANDDFVAVTADYQTAGRGQGSNSWESERGKNLLFSLRIRPTMVAPAQQFVLSMAGALALKSALDSYTDGITLKWPNDVYWNDRKISGTLIETSVADNMLKTCIFGIGINIRPPEGDFPEELRAIAGALPAAGGGDLRCRLAAAVLDRLMDFYDRLPGENCYEAYKSRSCLLGREINILPLGGEPIPATAIDVEPDFSLRVRLADGREELLSTGEVSVRAK